MDDIPDVPTVVRAIAERLSSVAPAGYSGPRVDGSMVWFGGSGSYVGDAFEVYLEIDPSLSAREARDPASEPTTIGDVIAAVAFKVMDELQDDVDEQTTEPWPGVRTVPKPHAVVQDDDLYMWFGDRDHPAAVCEPLSLRDLR